MKVNFEVELKFLIEVLSSAVDDREFELPPEINWERFLFWVDRHRVVGHVHYVLKQKEVPSFVKKQLAEIDRGNRLKALRLKAETLKLSNLLKESDIKSVSVKGVLLSEHLWGDLGRRYAGDIDLLVSLGDMCRAHEVMSSCGYMCAQMNWVNDSRIKAHLKMSHQIAYKKNGVYIELLRSVKSQFYHPEVMVSQNHDVFQVGRAEILIL